jgi:hypothetical protein
MRKNSHQLSAVSGQEIAGMREKQRSAVRFQHRSRKKSFLSRAFSKEG